MRILICSNPSENFPVIEGKYDLTIVCGICPVFDKKLITWNIVNSVDWIEDKFNPWIRSIDSSVKIAFPSFYDHIAEFYGSQLAYYLAAEYIQDETLLVKGLNIYSMPWSMPYHAIEEKSAFTARSKEFMNVAIESIPENSDIVIANMHSHFCEGDVLPHMHGDGKLRQKLDSVKKLKLFVHANEACESEEQDSKKYLTLCANQKTIGTSTVINM
jgi:hypothetical protein